MTANPNTTNAAGEGKALHKRPTKASMRRCRSILKNEAVRAAHCAEANRQKSLQGGSFDSYWAKSAARQQRILNDCAEFISWLEGEYGL